MTEHERDWSVVRLFVTSVEVAGAIGGQSPWQMEAMEALARLEADDRHLIETSHSAWHAGRDERIWLQETLKQPQSG